MKTIAASFGLPEILKHIYSCNDNNDSGKYHE